VTAPGPAEAVPSGAQADVRVSPRWLGLREPADAAARSRELAMEIRRSHAPGEPTVVHDLGCGSGSMGRWLAPLIEGPQHWVLHDRDVDLLALAANQAPLVAADGAVVTVETRPGDLTRLRSGDLAGASLVTASALLDMLTADELRRLVRCSIGGSCPWLVTLSVTGWVELTPRDPLDTVFRVAFNDHQRRTVAGRALLGPDAVGHATVLWRSMRADVTTRPSRWQLDASCRSLTREWLDGWVGAACEQRPELTAAGAAYLARRTLDLDRGRLSVTVHHRDVLVRPGPRAR
jgi:hypothetical protein